MMFLSLDMYSCRLPYKICIVLIDINDLVEDRPLLPHLRRLMYTETTLDMASSVHAIHMVVVVIDSSRDIELFLALSIEISKRLLYIS